MHYLHKLSQPITYCSDPSLLFNHLCQNKANTLLLESAQIGNKNAINSMLVASSALKIKAIDNVITYTALNANGKQILASFVTYLQDYIANYESTSTIEFTGEVITLTISGAHSSLNEDAKLNDLNIFAGLRSIQNYFQQLNDRKSDNNKVDVFFAGLFSYDVVLQFISVDTTIADNLECPTYVFYLAEQIINFQHQEQSAILNSFCFAEDCAEQIKQEAQAIIQKSQERLPIIPKLINKNSKVNVNISDSDFNKLIVKIKEHLYAGDVFQIVPSRCFSVDCDNPLSSYTRLKATNPSPYMFYIQDADFVLFGASPESALKFNPEDRQVEVYPIAGSRPRGLNPDGTINHEFDSRLELELRLNTKEQAEHLMLVDLARNDIARISVPGTRKVVDLMTVDKYSHVMHLVSRVVGTLRAELDALHAYQASMNMGTLTGSPKVKAMSLLYKYEQQKRAYYGGAVGYFNSTGMFDTCIVIRSAYVKDNIAYVSAGAGCVIDSVPQLETEETSHKARAVLNAIVHVQQGN